MREQYRMRLWCLAALVFVAVGLPQDLEAGTYYVSPSGNDAAAGTIGDPWRTFAKASSGLQPGDTVYFREGDGNELYIPEVGIAPCIWGIYKS